MAFLFIFGFLFVLSTADANLKPDFYQESCPQYGSIIERVVTSAIAKEQRMGASLLRLHFHDCYINGCDASILLDDTPYMTGEKHSPLQNNSIRGFEVIDEIKSQLESECPGIVSCADVLAVAARDSVVALGGPSWTVLLGRKDSQTASVDDTRKNLPPAFGNFSGLIQGFADKGLNPKDLVVLSGAHTIGQAKCGSIFFRLYNNDLNIDPALKVFLNAQCHFPKSLEEAMQEEVLVPMDDTPTVFDNMYYKDLLTFRSVLYSDQTLFSHGPLDSMVVKYSENSTAFFEDFGNSMIKMGNIRIRTEKNGVVRKNCRKSM